MGASFWTFNIGQLGSVLVVIGSIVAAFNRYHGKINESFKEIKNLSERIEAIDRLGTSASRSSLIRDHEVIHSTIHRIEQLEKVTASLSPKLTEVATNVDWISHYIKDAVNSSKKLV
jgi:methyl-accepting chemotaxis protein